MKTVKYQDYISELERLKVQLEKVTCVKEIYNRIWFVNIGTNDAIQLGVNIAGTGDITSTVATRFAYCIEVAATLAEKFKYNGYAIG